MLFYPPFEQAQPFNPEDFPKEITKDPYYLELRNEFVKLLEDLKKDGLFAVILTCKNMQRVPGDPYKPILLVYISVYTEFYNNTPLSAATRQDITLLYDELKEDYDYMGSFCFTFEKDINKTLFYFYAWFVEVALGEHVSVLFSLKSLIPSFLIYVEQQKLDYKNWYLLFNSEYAPIIFYGLLSRANYLFHNLQPQPVTAEPLLNIQVVRMSNSLDYLLVKKRYLDATFK
jgi:hypothetical protein